MTPRLRQQRIALLAPALLRCALDLGTPLKVLGKVAEALPWGVTILESADLSPDLRRLFCRDRSARDLVRATHAAIEGTIEADRRWSASS